MRIPLCLAAIGFVFGLACPVFAQESTADAATLELLTKMEKNSWEASLRGDKEFFRNYLVPEAKWFLADGSVIGREEVLRNFDDFQLKKYSMGKVTMLKVNEDAIMIMYSVSYEGVHKKQKETFADIESSSLYVRRDGTWREIFYQETPREGASHGTAAEAKQLVAKAIDLVAKKGTSAFEVISNGSEGFRDRDLYVVVSEVGNDGKVVAHGGAQLGKELVGQLIRNIKSPDGDPIGKWIQEKATEEGTWIDYSFLDPATNQVEHKFLWIVRSGKFIFGCGIYTPTK